MFSRNLILIILIAVVFGLAGGIVGDLVARTLLFESTFNIPIFRDIDLSGENGGSSFVITGAKRVIVEQDQKVAGTIDLVDDSIVGVYQKKKGATSTKEVVLNLDEYYFLGDQLGQGFVITSDGWMITEFLPREFAQTIFNERNNKLIKNNIMKNFVVIDKENEIYDIEDVVIDEEYSFVYLKIDAGDLPVREFAGEQDINSGQVVLALNWQGRNLLTTISEIKTDESLVKSSDAYLSEFVLNDEISKDLYSSYLFSLNGDLTGLINKNGQVLNINNFMSAIRGLLESREIKRAELGINYIDLSELIKTERNGQDKGALIYKNSIGVAVEKDSLAEIAGLEEGDIIISINNTELDKENSLNKIINKYLEGDTIRIKYERGENIKEVDIRFVSEEK